MSPWTFTRTIQAHSYRVSDCTQLPPVQRLSSFVQRVATLLVFTLHADLCCPLFFMCSEIEVNGKVKNALSSLNDDHQTFSGLRLIFLRCQKSQKLLLIWH